MTTETFPRRNETQKERRFSDRPPPGWLPGRPGRLGRLVLIVVAFALAVALVTYGISSAISPTYRSSTQLLVNVNEANGLGVDAITAANDLTAQYVQLVPTDAVLATPAAKLGMSVGDLRNDISAGTVSQENLLQINADGPSASAAQHRADTVSSDFMSFLAHTNSTQLHSYVSALSRQLQSVNNDYAQLAARLQNARGAQAAYIQGELGALSAQQQSLQSQVTQHATAGVPMIQLVHPASRGGRGAPQPALYALVALLVAGFLAAQAAAWDYRRRRSAP
jgi:uncharacterized protein involved in exopolysaccharide biosynthesis